LNKFNILKDLQYTDDEIPFPVVDSVQEIDTTSGMVAFSKCRGVNSFPKIVHFYEPDSNFAQVLHNPNRYVDLLKSHRAVVGPDFSQKIGYTPFVCFENSWWNKALSAYWQSMGVVVIPNVTWSKPDSFRYAFKGLPRNSVIAINCTGILSSHASMYFWRKGYDEAIRVLNPKLILRYGDKMPGEYSEISLYFENQNLKNLRNGC
jgi:hypothetical protein